MKAFPVQKVFVAVARESWEQTAGRNRVDEEFVSPPMVAQRSSFVLRWRRPNNVSHSADEQVGATGLHSTAVGIEIDMAHRLPTAQTAEDEIFAIRVDHICGKKVSALRNESGSALNYPQTQHRFRQALLRRVHLRKADRRGRGPLFDVTFSVLLQQNL